MSGGGSGGGSAAPSSTTSNNTETVINQAPAYEQQYISDLLGQAATTAAQPYQQFPGQQVADLTPDQTNAFSQIENLEGSGTGGAAATQGTAADAAASSGANTANGIYGAGAPYLQASAGYNPLTAASPYLQASAATNTPQGISAYMSPYLNNDITGLQNTAEQTWNQFTAPSINNSFISSGQAGSGRNAQVIGQQANLADQSLEGQIASAENAAYTTAGNQANAAASNLGQLGSTAGSTAASEAANLQGIGTGLGNLASTQAGAQANAASNLANTASTVQNTGVTGAAALQSVGQQQQNQNQSNINTAISNFNAQNLWPETQESFLNSIINGLPSPGTSTSSAGQTPTTTNQIGSTSPLSTLAGTLIGTGAVTSKRGGLIGYASGGIVDDDIPPPPARISIPSNAPDEIPAINASSLSPLAYAAPVNDNSDEESHASTPLIVKLPSSDGEHQKNPLRTIDPDPSLDTKSVNFQLLSMARGLLTPAHSTGEALGNGIGDYLKTSMEMPSYQGAQQDVVAKQLGNAQTYAALQRQNTVNQANGMPTLPLPNIAGMSGNGRPALATTTSNGQINPISGGNQTQTLASAQPQGGDMNLMQALSIANGSTQASEDKKYQAVLKLQASQYPVPAVLAEEAKQYGQDAGKLANAGSIKGAEVSAQQSAEMPYVGLRAAAEAKAKATYPETITARQNETTYAPFAGIQVNGAQSGVGNGGAGYMTDPSISSIQNMNPNAPSQPTIEPESTVAGKITQAISTPVGQGSYGTPQGSRLTSVPKDVTDWVKEYPTQRDALAQQMSSITTINNAINGLSSSGVVGMGTGAEERRNFANAINTAQKIAGVSDPNLMYDPNKIANADEFTKSSLALAQARAKQLGARVTNFEMSSAQKQNPSLSMPELSARLLTNINGEGVQREIDRQDFVQSSIKNGISPSDASKNFEQIASPDLYVKRAQSQIVPIKVSSPSDLGGLMPGTKVMDAKGRTGYVPIPSNYPLHVMPISPLYRGQ